MMALERTSASLDPRACARELELAPSTAPSLRPYQENALARIEGAVGDGVRRILLVMPTGAGKTLLAAHFILRCLAEGKRVLFVAHRREIILQTVRTLRAVGIPEHELGLILSGEPLARPRARVLVGSVQTLARAERPHVDVLIIDEAHRALASTYGILISRNHDALILGMTATPWRIDRRPMAREFRHLVVGATTPYLVEAGYLVAPEVFVGDELPDLTRVPIVQGDYAARELGEAVDRDTLVTDIVQHWDARASGIRTVVFAASIPHSQHITAAFVAAGVPAEHLDGRMAKDDRDAVLARLERGETLVVSSCQVLSEGWDQPSVKCAVLARPTRSVTMYLQQAGRILRPWRGVGAILLDHSGNVALHGRPEEPRGYDLRAARPLEPTVVHAPSSPPPPSTLVALRRACAGCGAVHAREAFRDGDVVHDRCAACRGANEPLEPRAAIPPAAPSGVRPIEGLTRDQRRNRRRREVRGQTINVDRLPKRDLEIGRLENPNVDDVERPKTRADCENGIRPCPFVSCKHHLYLDVNEENGSIKLNFPDLEVDELTESCALDFAGDGATLERVSELLNVTRERVRQIEARVIDRMKHRHPHRLAHLREFAQGDARRGGGMLELLADGGGGGDGVAETTDSLFSDRGAALDKEALFRNRVFEIYERTASEATLARGAGTPLEYPPPLEREGEERVVAGVYVPGTPRRHAPTRFGDTVTIWAERADEDAFPRVAGELVWEDADGLEWRVFASGGALDLEAPSSPAGEAIPMLPTEASAAPDGTSAAAIAARDESGTPANDDAAPDDNATTNDETEKTMGDKHQNGDALLGPNGEKALAAIRAWFEEHDEPPQVRNLTRTSGLDEKQLANALYGLKRKGVVVGGPTDGGYRLPAVKAARTPAKAKVPPAKPPAPPPRERVASAPSPHSEVPPEDASFDIEAVLERKVAFHERKAAELAHHEAEARRARAALDAFRKAS